MNQHLQKKRLSSKKINPFDCQRCEILHNIPKQNSTPYGHEKLLHLHRSCSSANPEDRKDSKSASPFPRSPSGRFNAAGRTCESGVHGAHERRTNHLFLWSDGRPGAGEGQPARSTRRLRPAVRSRWARNKESSRTKTHTDGIEVMSPVEVKLRFTIC